MSALEAAHCLAFGRGGWRKEPRPARERYLIDKTSYLPHFHLSKWWWGSCDDDIRRATWSNGQRRPPRAELSYTWMRRHGHGCATLNHNRIEPPTADRLSASFCRRWQGRTLLFVGDSQQAELFTSFAQLVGIVNTTYTTTSRCFARKRKYGAVGRGSQEVDVQVRLCSPAPGGVLAIFKRNEGLFMTHEENEHDYGFRLPAMLCDWHEQAVQADLVLLNRGMWKVSDPIHVKQLNKTFGLLRESFARAGRDASDSVLFRSTWASLDECKNLSDPLRLADADRSLREQSKTERGRLYGWGRIDHQNGLSHKVAADYGLKFWDIFNATLVRPGGRRDCAHWCLPGPLDDLTLELLAYLTLPSSGSHHNQSIA